jgi:hypothetical protein
MMILGLLVLLIIIGVVIWLVNTYIPMPGWMKTVITVVAILITLLVVLRAFGIFETDARVPQL